jgi:GT2 family glycosyltransferase
LSRGRYLTWTSDDNLYRPQAIAQMVAALDRAPGVALVYARSTFVDSEGRPQGQSVIAPPDHLANSNVVGACFLYRREVYEAIGGYDEELFLVEDWDYWIRVAEKFNLQALPEDLYLYRYHQDSLSSQREERVWSTARELLERHLPNMQWASSAARSRGYLVAASVAWRFGQRREAIHLTGRAIAQNPGFALTRMIRRSLNRLRGKRQTFP